MEIRLKLTAKVMILIISTISIAILLLSFLYFRDVKAALDNEFIQRCGDISTRLSEDLSYPVYVKNMDLIKQTILKYNFLTDFSGIIIRNKEKKTIFKWGDIGGYKIKKELFFKISPEKKSYFVGEEKSKVFKVEHLGSALVFFSTLSHRELLSKIRNKLVFLTIIVLFSVLISFYLSSKAIIEPINIIKTGIERIEKGDLTEIDMKPRDDEIGELVKAINKMVKSLKEANKKIEDTYKELNRKDKLAYLGRLSATIAHEMKNPLGIINSSAQMLTKETDPDKIKELTQFIIEETRRLDNVIKEFLQFARPKKLEKTPFTVNALMDRIVLLWEMRSRPDVILKNNCRSEAKVLVDREIFSQAVMNLLTNSLESFSDGGTIEINCQEKNEHVSIVVKDNGPGIDKENLDKIFEPFFTTKKSGTGLGLSIVYDIISEHNGKIVVETDENGTTFEIILRRYDGQEKDSDS